jgi:hypothetical protein
MEFKPPVCERETNELIKIVKQRKTWNPTIVDQARRELQKRGINEEVLQRKLVNGNPKRI